MLPLCNQLTEPDAESLLSALMMLGVLSAVPLLMGVVGLDGHWLRTFGRTGNSSHASSEAWGASASAPDGSVVVVGEFHGEELNFRGMATTLTRTLILNDRKLPAEPSTIGSDCFFAKFDKRGTLLWANQAGDPHFLTEDCSALAVAIDPRTGHAHVTGSFSRALKIDGRTLVPPAEFQTFLITLDGATGRVQHAAATQGPSFTLAKSMTRTPRGTTVVVGYGYRDGMMGLFVREYSTSGADDMHIISQLEMHTDDGTSIGNSVVSDARGHLLVAGGVMGGYGSLPTGWSLPPPFSMRSTDLFLMNLTLDPTGGVPALGWMVRMRGLGERGELCCTLDADCAVSAVGGARPRRGERRRRRLLLRRTHCRSIDLNERHL